MWEGAPQAEPLVIAGAPRTGRAEENDMTYIDSTDRIGVEAELAYRRESISAAFDKSGTHNSPVRRFLHYVNELLHSA
jgi:hypothetical protein